MDQYQSLVKYLYHDNGKFLSNVTSDAIQWNVLYVYIYIVHLFLQPSYYSWLFMYEVIYTCSKIYQGSSEL